MITVSHLPLEILVHIFELLGRNSKSLAQVTEVCADWRAIAISTPYLWTRINVRYRSLNENQILDLLKYVSLSLDRTGDLLLDIQWHSRSANPEYTKLFFNLFQEKAPFNRWKSLSWGLHRSSAHELPGLREADNFSNLASLDLFHSPPDVYLDLISKTVTKKLHSLNFWYGFQYSPFSVPQYAKLFSHVKKIETGKGVVLPALLFPSNVTELHLGWPPSQPIINIKHLSIKQPVHILQLVSIDYSNLQSLNFCPIGMCDNTTINLPRVRRLGYYGTSYRFIKYIKAPMLHTLEIGDRISVWQEEALLLGLENGFEAPKLSSLYVSPRPISKFLGKVMQLFPYLKGLYIMAYDENDAKASLADVFPEPGTSPSLVSLYLRLEVAPLNKLDWRSYVESTASRIGEPLRIMTVEWPVRQSMIIGTLGHVEDFLPSYEVPPL